MIIKSLFFILLGLLCLALTTVHARKDPGVYWRGVMKDEPMPELIQSLLGDVRESSSSPTKPHHSCDPSPNASSYNHASSSSKHKVAKSSHAKEFEPRPNVSSYNDDSKVKAEKSYTKQFDPRPNVSSYNDDSKLKSKEFEPRPNVSAYTDDVKGEEDVPDGVVKDFEPRPNVSVYDE